MGVSTTHSINLCMWILIYWHTLRLGCLWQNMHGFDHATILSPSFHGLCKERLAQWPPHLYTAISRSVVGKSARYNPERYCGWCRVLWSSKKFEKMAREATDICLRVLKESNKSMFDRYSRQEQCIDHIPYYLSGFFACTFFPTTCLEITVYIWINWGTVRVKLFPKKKAT